MRDRLLKVTGIACAAMACAMLAAGLFPLRDARERTFAGRGQADNAEISPLPHLTEEDPLNLEGAEAFIALPGVGSSIAAMILTERNENGRFWYPEDLTSVRGIGVKKLEQIRPYLHTETGEREE